MRSVFVLVSVLLALQTIHAQSNEVTTTKKCEDFLAKPICDKFRRIAATLQEKASTVNDAINAAVAKHLNNTKEIIKFVNEYLALNINCGKVLGEKLCQQLQEAGQNAKLTILAIKEAIEQAVANGATTAKDIFNKTIEVMKTMINCDLFLGQTACANLKIAAQKLGEQYQLVKDAIFAAAQKHFTNAKDFFNFVTKAMIDAAKNFKCETVMTESLCNAIRSIAKTLHIQIQIVREAIETAIINGAQNAKDIFNATLTFLTTKINCENILSKLTCDNLKKAIDKLHEQRLLLQEALLEAAKHHLNNTKEILKFVQGKLVEAAKNFKCVNILGQKYCDFLIYVAKRFHIRTQDLMHTIIEVIVNGTSSAKQIYDKTLGALVEEAKNLKCEQLIDENTCDVLKALANNLHVQLSQVTLAVREAIVSGVELTTQILKFAKEFIVEKTSCNNFLSKAICDKIEKLADSLHVSFKAVINKLREWFANGVNIATMPLRITKYIWDQFWGQSIGKRSLDMTDEKLAKIIAQATLEHLLSNVNTAITDMKKILNGNIIKRDAFLETGSLIPGSLIPGGWETVDLEKGGLEKGGLETVDLEKGGLEKGGLETVDLEKGGLIPGGLIPGGFGYANNEPSSKLEKAKKYFEGFMKKLKDQLNKLKEMISKLLHNKASVENHISATYKVLEGIIKAELPEV